jgi:hypothetical protein
LPAKAGAAHPTMRAGASACLKYYQYILISPILKAIHRRLQRCLLAAVPKKRERSLSPEVMQAGGHSLRENCHDQDSRRPSGKVARTDYGVGRRWAHDVILVSVVAYAHCTQFRGPRPGNGTSTLRQSELATRHLFTSKRGVGIGRRPHWLNAWDQPGIFLLRQNLRNWRRGPWGAQRR